MHRKEQAAPRRSLEHRLAGVLCYLLWMFSAMLLLMFERESRFVRFHALQSIMYTAVVAFVLGALALAEQYAASGVAGLLAISVWLFLMYRAARGDWFGLPALGWVAERSA